MTGQDQAVVHAAIVWFIARTLRTDGAVYHQACKALEDAVAVYGGGQVAAPTLPPSSAAIDASIALVSRLRERR